MNSYSSDNDILGHRYRIFYRDYYTIPNECVIYRRGDSITGTFTDELLGIFYCWKELYRLTSSSEVDQYIDRLLLLQ